MNLDITMNDYQMILAFEHVIDAVEKNAADIVQQVGEKAVQDAKKAAPVLKKEYHGSLNVQGGELRASIYGKFSAKGSQSKYTVIAGYPDIIDKGTGEQARRKSNTKKQNTSQRIYYAMAVEYGTKTQKAQPFLGPIRRKLPRKLNTQLKKVMAKAWEESIR